MDDQSLQALEDKKFLANSKDRARNTQQLLEGLKPKDEIKVELMGAEVVTIKGKKGDKGDTGEKGEQGIQGETGIQGEKGEKGDPGEKGEPGIQGVPGADSSVPGPQGERGEPGKDGKDGKSIKNETIDVKSVKGLDKVLNETGSNILAEARSFIPRALASQYDVAVQNMNNNSTLQYNTGTQKWFNGISLTVSATAPSDPKLNDLWISL